MIILDKTASVLYQGRKMKMTQNDIEKQKKDCRSTIDDGNMLKVRALE